MSKQDVLLAIHNCSEMKSLANNAKIRSSLKFLLIELVGNLFLYRQCELKILKKSVCHYISCTEFCHFRDKADYVTLNRRCMIHQLAWWMVTFMFD